MRGDGKVVRPRLLDDRLYQVARGVRVELDLAHATGGESAYRRIGISRCAKFDLSWPYEWRSGKRLAGQVESRSRNGIRRDPLVQPSLQIATPDGIQEAFWACVAMTDPLTYFRKRPLRVVPHADGESGLDLVAGKSMGFWRTLRWLQQAMGSGKHARHPEIVHLDV